MKHVLGFSGGIDSQACARWLLNRYPAEDVVLVNSNAGGNEHWLTTQHIHWYSKNIRRVVMLEPTIADMDGRARKKLKALGLSENDPLTFGLMAELKGMFPSRLRQFCTYHLKLMPQKRWSAGWLSEFNFRRYAGIRRDESIDRSKRQFVAYDEMFKCEIHLPVLDWTKQMCFDYVRSHGEKVNPLYSLGFNRVGCAPCVNNSKDDVLNWVKRFPEMIDKVREWEKRVGKTFFAPVVPSIKKRGGVNWIDDVVKWAKTVRGGRQYSLHVLESPPACESAFHGLCE